jgi:hypothetical protein
LKFFLQQRYRFPQCISNDHVTVGLFTGYRPSDRGLAIPLAFTHLNEFAVCGLQLFDNSFSSATLFGIGIHTDPPAPTM